MPVGSSSGRLANSMVQILLTHAANTPPKTDALTRNKVLFHSWGFRAIPLVCFGIAIMMGLISMVTSPWDDFGETIAFSACLAFFVIAGLVILPQSFISRITISDEGVNGKTPIYSHKVRWEDIVELKYSGLSESFVITARNGQKTRVSLAFNGIKHLVNCFEEHLQPDIYAKAKDVFEEVKARVKAK